MSSRSWYRPDNLADRLDELERRITVAERKKLSTISVPMTRTSDQVTLAAGADWDVVYHSALQGGKRTATVKAVVDASGTTVQLYLTAGATTGPTITVSGADTATITVAVPTGSPGLLQLHARNTGGSDATLSAVTVELR